AAAGLQLAQTCRRQCWIEVWFEGLIERNAVNGVLCELGLIVAIIGIGPFPVVPTSKIALKAAHEMVKIRLRIKKPVPALDKARAHSWIGQAAHAKVGLEWIESVIAGDGDVRGRVQKTHHGRRSQSTNTLEVGIKELPKELHSFIDKIVLPV